MENLAATGITPVAGFPCTLIKLDHTKTAFMPYKIELVLRQLGVTAQIPTIMTQVKRRLGKRQTVTANDVRTTLMAIFTALDLPQIAQAYQLHKVAADEAFKRATNPTLRLQRLLNRDDTLVHENANKDSHVFNTQRDLTAGTVGKTLGLKMMPSHVAKAHLRGDIHYHDLDYTPWSPMTNCCLIDFKEMLNNGFKIGNAEVTSPNSIQTATAHHF